MKATSLADLSSSDEFSDLEHDALEEMFDSDEDQHEFEGFAFDLPEDMTWERQHFNVNDKPLTHAPGPTMNLPDSGKVIDFFLLYFSEEIIGNIVEFTNKNAQVKQAQNWQPVRPEELRSQCHPKCLAPRGTFFIYEKSTIFLIVVKSDLYLHLSLPLAIRKH